MLKRQEAKEWLENPYTKEFFKYLKGRAEVLRQSTVDTVYARGKAEETLSRCAEIVGALNECITIHEVSAGEDMFQDAFDLEEENE